MPLTTKPTSSGLGNSANSVSKASLKLKAQPSSSNGTLKQNRKQRKDSAILDEDNVQIEIRSDLDSTVTKWSSSSPESSYGTLSRKNPLFQQQTSLDVAAQPAANDDQETPVVAVIAEDKSRVNEAFNSETSLN
jgi:hypothetical protein